MHVTAEQLWTSSSVHSSSPPLHSPPRSPRCISFLSRGKSTRSRLSPLPNGVQIVCSGCAADEEDRFAADDLAATFQSRNIPTTAAGGFRIELARLANHPVAEFTDEMKPEGYVITSAPGSLIVVGATAQGLFYGVQTVKQLIEGEGAAATLHTADIRDWPAMRYRGISDDFARGPLPTVEFQKKQIRIMAAYKLNIYSLYFQHAMEYKAIPLMGPPGGGTFTQAQARELVAYAARYHITVIPEQESFGHLHYLLDWEQYSPLAETPHGDVLAPGQPSALQLTHQMFAEMAGIYPGPFLHIGADETSDLGRGRTKAQVDARGAGAVYLDYLQQIVTDLEPLKRKLLFWGDIAMHDPALLKQVPDNFKKNTIAVAWEYEPHPEGFAPFITPFTDAHIETWVSPGINNWSRVYPNYNKGLTNIQQFTAQGQQLGATGQLNTIWDDDGETLANNNWYGILFGAEAAWHKGEASIPGFQSSYGASFHGDLTGKIDQAQKEIMTAVQILGGALVHADESDYVFWMIPGLSKASVKRHRFAPSSPSSVSMPSAPSSSSPRPATPTPLSAKPMLSTLSISVPAAWTSSASNFRSPMRSLAATPRLGRSATQQERKTAQRHPGNWAKSNGECKTSARPIRCCAIFIRKPGSRATGPTT